MAAANSLAAQPAKSPRMVPHRPSSSDSQDRDEDEEEEEEVAVGVIKLL